MDFPVEIVDRVKFDLKINEMFAKKEGPRVAPDRDHLTYLAAMLTDIQEGVKKTSLHYHFEKKYKLVVIDGDTKHVCLKKKAELIYLVPIEDYYDKLLVAHLETGHGGRDRMHYYCKQKWIINKSACQLFASMCNTCDRKRVAPTKGVVVKSILSKGFNARGQVDLIDLQSCPDGKYFF